MYRIRFHGRGGQGMRTASRILGRALFNEGYQVQDAPRYGAERRGAPIFAYVRCSSHPINERGIIHHPGLVVVADPSLLAMPTAAVLQGCTKDTVLLINSNSPVQLPEFQGIIVTFSHSIKDPENHFTSSSCAGGTAALLGLISLPALETAARVELSNLKAEDLTTNMDILKETFLELGNRAGAVQPGSPVSVHNHCPPDWVDLPLEQGAPNMPAIISSMTSHRMNTGSWRTKRPVINHQSCNRCWWICNTFCPDGAIFLDENRYPHIDHGHCKGCLICMSQCPTGAITAIAEHPAATENKEENA